MNRVSLLLLTTLIALSKSLSASTAAVQKAGGTGAHLPIGKDGEGEYTAATKGCFDVIDVATPLVLDEIAKQPIRANGSPSIHIADFGTADAGTSLGLLSKMVKAYRERLEDENKEVVIHYEDQLTNEWQSVFNHALGLKSVTDAYGNPVDTPFNLGSVFAEACGVGFHYQCYPSNSIDFGISFTAMHWLSQFPSSLRGKDYMHAARCPEAPVAEKEQAAEDWRSILKARAKELVPGGRFVCANFCVSKEGYFLGQTDVGASMWDSFQESWDKLKANGLIDEDERLDVSFPSYYRSMKEFVSAVDEVDTLKVVSAEEKIVRCPYRELYDKGKTNMSPREYAEWFVPTTKTWSHSTFRSALKDDRSDDEKDEIMDQFWENYMALVAENPGVHGMDYVHVHLVLEKTDARVNLEL